MPPSLGWNSMFYLKKKNKDTMELFPAPLLLLGAVLREEMLAGVFLI